MDRKAEEGVRAVPMAVCDTAERRPSGVGFDKPIRGRATSLAVALLSFVPLLVACAGNPTPPPSGLPSAASISGATPSPVRVAALKGPTTMGLVGLMDRASRDQTAQQYSFDIQGTPDAVSGPLVAGNLDIALIPVNLAAVLYNKTNGGVLLANVNTLGVLYIVTGDPAITSLTDLAGRTVLNSGQGTTPQFVIDEVLASAGLASVDVTYRSQPTEEASILAATPTTIAVLPEPYASVVMAANPAVHIVSDLNQAWQQDTGVPLVTACVAIRSAFADSYPGSVATFMDEYAASVGFVNNQPDQAAPLIVAQGLAPNADVAQAAIPRAHIVDMRGADAKAAVSAYLNVLYAADPTSVGGSIPDDGFYLDV